MADKKTVLLVAAHKEYRMPEDPVYLPLQVGAALHAPLPYAHDDNGDHISEKNPNYCELTGLYWAWKNLPADALGLCHYRRYFAEDSTGDKWSRILSGKRAEELLKEYDAILPRKRNYWIETNYSQYVHAHHAEDLDTLREILAEKYPEYLPAFDAYMAKTKGHQFNMFLMRRELTDAYCTWLFDVLGELEARLDISGYDKVNQRVFGFVSERLLDPWVETNHIHYTELPVINMERQNWLKKGGRFLLRKWKGTIHR